MSQIYKPFLKWAGGKRQLVKEIEILRIKTHGTNFNDYYEPFVGGGANLFFLQPKKSIYINDINAELVCLYNSLKNDIVLLQKELQIHELHDSENYYYEIRKWDRETNFEEKYSKIQRAGRFLYLNKRCYNGLYRVNSKNQFNVPYGKYAKKLHFDLSSLELISEYFNKHNICISSNDYAQAVSSAKKGDLVYFDPPYFPLNSKYSFDMYTSSGFGANIIEKKKEQIRLKKVADELSGRGCFVIISNSDTEFIKELYSNENTDAKGQEKYFIYQTVRVTRMINSKVGARGVEHNSELIIINNVAGK